MLNKYENVFFKVEHDGSLFPSPLVITGVGVSTSLYHFFLEKSTVLTDQIIHSLKI